MYSASRPLRPARHSGGWLLTERATPTLNIGVTVDIESGLVDRRIFFERDIYELELERIFARAWNFMAQDSQIPTPGDFFLTFIGEDRVIVVRDNDGSPQVLVNSCRHRGNAVCRAEEGHATSFMCTYHGWTYDLKGDLVGVPGFKEVYHEELDRDAWGLIKAARVDSYHGFIFASMDAAAPDLEQYLGDVGRLCVDLIAAKGEMRIAGGVQKFTIPCNWKFVADNVSDEYHLDVTHASTYMSRISRSKERTEQRSATKFTSKKQRVWLGEYGHVWAGPLVSRKMRKRIAGDGAPGDSWREKAKARQALGIAVNSKGTPHVFPNFSTTSYHVTLRLPKGARQTEVWLFAFRDQDLPIEDTRQYLRWINAHCGPGGIVDQDDSENWEQSTKGVQGSISRRFPFHYAMGLGHGEYVDEEGSPPRIEAKANEHGQRWYYRAWSEWMASDSWAELKANHSPVLFDLSTGNDGGKPPTSRERRQRPSGSGD